MEPLNTLARSEFARRLRVVSADDWQRPTPCDDWTVRDLVGRAVARRQPRGATSIRKTLDLGDDAVAAFDAEADQVAAAFAEPYALHAWDLAQAIGADEKLDDDLVREVWNALAPMAGRIGKSGVYGAGPTGQVDDTAPLQERLLDLTGRTR